MPVNRFRLLRTYSLSPGTISRLKEIRDSGTPAARAIDRGVNMYWSKMKRMKK